MPLPDAPDFAFASSASVGAVAGRVAVPMTEVPTALVAAEPTTSSRLAFDVAPCRLRRSFGKIRRTMKP